MLRLPLASIAKPDLEALVAGQTPESRSLDYKRDLNLDSEADKKEFCKDVSSFANASGGFLVFGVEERKDDTGKSGLGYPEKMLGVACPNWDTLKQRIENVVRDRLAPRIQGLAMHKVEGFDRGPVVILHIPRSWTGPHMVWFGQTHFYSRNSTGVHPLDAREIGHAFRAGSDQVETLRRFRDTRLGGVLAGETPVPLWANDSKLVIHVCPLDEEPAAGDFPKPERMPPLATGSGWNHRNNLDGFLTYSGAADGPKRSYSLALRNGAFEGVAIVDRRRDQQWFFGQGIERTILEGVGLFASLLRDRQCSGPVAVLAALTDVYGVRIVWDQHNELPWTKDDRIDRATLVLPDVLLENAEADLSTELKPIFDALWQSSGWPSSPSYDPATGKRRTVE